MATYIIGDVQGCYDPLMRLIDKLRFDPASDQLWFAGDLVNRGGQSLEVLRFLYSIKQSVKTVMGNHDLRLLTEDWRYPDAGCGNLELDAILTAHDREDLITWLRQAPFLIRHKPSSTILVHAGLLPEWDIPMARRIARKIEALITSKNAGKLLKRLDHREQSRWKPDLPKWHRTRLAIAAFTRLRFCNRNGKLDTRESGPPGSQRNRKYQPWYSWLNKRNEKWHVVFGHWAALGLYQSAQVTCLDSGCVWGRKLTAMRLEDRKITQVKARRK